jgi:hypothetical protein
VSPAPEPSVSEGSARQETTGDPAMGMELRQRTFIPIRHFAACCLLPGLPGVGFPGSLGA